MIEFHEIDPGIAQAGYEAGRRAAEEHPLPLGVAREIVAILDRRPEPEDVRTAA